MSKKFYKKKLFWIIVVIALIIMVMTSPDSETDDTSRDSDKVVAEDQIANGEEDAGEEAQEPEKPEDDGMNGTDGDNSASGSGSISDTLEDLVDGIASDMEDSKQYVAMVKGGTNSEYPDITYEEAFDQFFANPKWKYFESDEGEHVVEFTGKCMYQDVEVKARIQFVLDLDNGTFELTYLALNDVPQDMLMADGLLQAAFEE